MSPSQRTVTMSPSSAATDMLSMAAIHVRLEAWRVQSGVGKTISRMLTGAQSRSKRNRPVAWRAADVSPPVSQYQRLGTGGLTSAARQKAGSPNNKGRRQSPLCRSAPECPLLLPKSRGRSTLGHSAPKGKRRPGTLGGFPNAVLPEKIRVYAHSVGFTVTLARGLAPALRRGGTGHFFLPPPRFS